MIFNVPGHIEMIRNGQKTQTRRINRGVYQAGRNYAIQRKRGMNAETDIRIVMDKIWIERYAQYLPCYVSKGDAMAEGGYESPIDFEVVFRKLNPGWRGERWAFKFHVIEVKK